LYDAIGKLECALWVPDSKANADYRANINIRIMRGKDYTRGMRLPCVLPEEPDVEKGSNNKAFQEPFGVEGHTQDALFIIPFAPNIIVNVHAL
jgi:hypothetical protein